MEKTIDQVPNPYSFLHPLRKKQDVWRSAQLKAQSPNNPSNVGALKFSAVLKWDSIKENNQK